MPREFNFQFKDLVIDYQEIIAALGYQNSELPSPFDEMLEEAIADAHKLKDIRATYRIIDGVDIKDVTSVIAANGHEFRIGKTICREILGSDRLAFFICTAGVTISEKSVRLLKGDDPVLGYIYDVLGSAIAEAAGDKMQETLKNDAAESGKKITNRYSPGYCNWNVADQHKLFSLFGDSSIGVKLTPSALMHPVKSISGIIGIGKEVEYRGYQCALCSSKNCIYRTIRAEKL